METSEWITLGLGAAGIIGTGIGAMMRVRDNLNDKISATAKSLHEKLEEVKRDYVRRDDIRDDIQRLERGQENMTAKVDQMTASLIPAITKMMELVSGRNR